MLWFGLCFVLLVNCNGLYVSASIISNVYNFISVNISWKYPFSKIGQEMHPFKNDNKKEKKKIGFQIC